MRSGLSTSINNVSIMRLEGAMGIPLQVLVSEARKQWKTRVSITGNRVPCTLETGDYDAQMSGIKILKGDEIL
jgi:hypothetical protein